MSSYPAGSLAVNTFFLRVFCRGPVQWVLLSRTWHGTFFFPVSSPRRESHPYRGHSTDMSSIVLVYAQMFPDSLPEESVPIVLCALKHNYSEFKVSGV